MNGACVPSTTMPGNGNECDSGASALQPQIVIRFRRLTEPAMSPLDTLLDDLVAANRILAGLGVLDGFGHVSVRHPDRADRFFLSRSLAPELVTREDIQTYDLASNVQDGDTRTPYLERFIHGEILARRPEVQSVVHSHAATVVPFGTTNHPLRAIFHMSSFLRTGAPVFEMRERF